MYTKVLDGKAAVACKSAAADSRWISEYICKRWGCRPGHCSYLKLRRKVYRNIKVYHAELETGDALQKPGRKVVPGGHRCKVVNPTTRVRFASRTRQWNQTKMPELQHELFQWWLDLAQVLQARAPNSMIMAQARLMIEDARRFSARGS